MTWLEKIGVCLSCSYGVLFAWVFWTYYASVRKGKVRVKKTDRERLVLSLKKQTGRGWKKKGCVYYRREERNF